MRYLLIGLLLFGCSNEGDDVSSWFTTVCIDGVQYHKGNNRLAVKIDSETLKPMRCHE